MSLVAATADVTILTAVPGSGKTLRMIQMMRAHLAAGDLVYACNIDGLCLPGVMPFEDPTDWESLPPGAVLFVDEAQKFFRARRTGEPPAYIKAMEEIRHLGVRLVLSCQRPTYLDSHLRGLVGRHEHLVRKNGVDKAIIYRSHEIIDNVTGLQGRKGFDKETWSFPADCFQFYKSAEIHTRKYQMPTRMKAIIAIFSVAALAFLGVAGYAISAGMQQQKEADALAESARGGSSSVASTVGGAVRAGAGSRADAEPLTTDEYLARLVPRVPYAPWSAPAFDDREVASRPALYCMSTVDTCRCLTEQSTRYELDDATCRTIARHGAAYNPFLEPDRAISSRSQPATASTAPEAVQRPGRSARASRFNRQVGGDYYPPELTPKSTISATF